MTLVIIDFLGHAKHIDTNMVSVPPIGKKIIISNSIISLMIVFLIMPSFNPCVPNLYGFFGLQSKRMNYYIN